MLAGAGAVDAGGAAQAWEAAAGEGRERNRPGEAVFVREYEAGKMVRSEVLTAEELELVCAVPKPPKKARRKTRRVGAVAAPFLLPPVLLVVFSML